MITLLTGENSFEIQRELGRLVAAFDGQTEYIDGSELELRQLPDLLMGTSLFAEKRLILLKNLSENKTIWPELDAWLERLSSDIHLVLIEAKPDKRTRTYKELQKAAQVKEFKTWGERDTRTAEQWAIMEGKKLGLKLDASLARALVERTGIDQWRVFHALEKLAVLDSVDKSIIEDVIDLSPAENVFQLFETALRGDGAMVHDMILVLEQVEDPFRVFGLLSSQAFQLAVLALTDKPTAEVAKDIGAHPFVLSKLAQPARKLGRRGARELVTIFRDADSAMKTSSGEPWLVIERSLVKIAAI
jgi:DNA polymerase III delta subunit